MSPTPGETESVLHMYELDDGESYWIVAKSAEDALRFGRERYEIPADDEERVDVSAPKDMDAAWTIGWGDDGWDPLPEGAVVEEHPSGMRRVTATVRAWIAIHSEGDMVCATIW